MNAKKDLEFSLTCKMAQIDCELQNNRAVLATTKELNYFVLHSTNVTPEGGYRCIINATMYIFCLKYKKVAPGVYSVFLAGKRP